MFWDNFYNLCELKNTTPNAVCKELNLSTATATHWKNGTMPKGDVLFNIANLLDCSVDYLLGRTAEPQGKVANSQSQIDTGDRETPKFDKTTNQVAEIFQDLDVLDKAKVLNLIAELSEKKGA